MGGMVMLPLLDILPLVNITQWWLACASPAAVTTSFAPTAAMTCFAMGLSWSCE